MKTQRFVRTPLAVLIMAFQTNAVNAQESHDHATMEDDSVMVVTAPASSPLEVVTSPKRPRQPVPASDGSDYLKTIPGFHRYGPVARMATRFSAVCSDRVCVS